MTNGYKLQARRRRPACILSEWIIIFEIKMTATYEGYHAFTTPTWIVANEPDQLTTCNTMETERVLFAQGSTTKKKDQKLYMNERAVPKNIAPSCCETELGPSLAIAVENSRIPSGWWSRKLMANCQCNHWDYGVLIIIHIREHISSKL